MRLELIARARAAGLLSPHVSAEWGGLGLNHVGKAVVFEEAGYSPLGPVALNIKVLCSEAIWRIVDRSVQILGGQGVTGETIVERIFRDVRPFRIYDGPSEVHRWSIAKRILNATLTG